MNDDCDVDVGPNGLQNFPVLKTAVSNSNGTTVSVSLNSKANTGFRIEFFSDPTCDPSGFGQGKTFLGSGVLVTDSFCNASGSFNFSGFATGALVVTATATIIRPARPSFHPAQPHQHNVHRFGHLSSVSKQPRGATYRLKRKLNITDSTWQSIAGVTDLSPGASGPAHITDPGAVSLGKAFYRVRLL